MTRPAAAVLAEAAHLTPEQRACRAAAAGDRLALALPREVWLDHRYSVLPREVGRPRAVRRPPGEGMRPEGWFDFLQVV